MYTNHSFSSYDKHSAIYDLTIGIWTDNDWVLRILGGLLQLLVIALLALCSILVYNFVDTYDCTDLYAPATVVEKSHQEAYFTTTLIPVGKSFTTTTQYHPESWYIQFTSAKVNSTLPVSHELYQQSLEGTSLNLRYRMGRFSKTPQPQELSVIVHLEAR